MQKKIDKALMTKSSKFRIGNYHTLDTSL